MARVLIAGCGYVGEAAANAFHERGWEVEGWTSTGESAAKLSQRPYPVRAVDVTDRGALPSASGEFDVVVHCVSSRGGDEEQYRRLYFEGARNLLRAFPQATLLFTSSTSVYAQTDGEWATEESAAEPKHETGKILREAEQLVINQGGMAARLAGIYGPGRSYLLKRFIGGEAIIDSKKDRFVNQIHRDDAAAALFFLLDRQPRNNRGSRSRSESPAAEIYNVVDDQPILQSECYRWLAAKLNRPVPPTGKSTSNRKRGRSNKRVSNAKLRALGWNPRYPTFSEAMEKSILPGFAQLGA